MIEPRWIGRCFVYATCTVCEIRVCAMNGGVIRVQLEDVGNYDAHLFIVLIMTTSKGYCSAE